MSRFDVSTSGAEVVAAFPKEIEGRTFVITGPTAGGLGAQTAIFLAKGKPDEIILLGRNEAKSTSVIAEIQSISPSTAVQFVQVDLSRFDSVRTAAAVISRSVRKIDVLINNAGIMAVKDFTLTPEGLESQFGANHIGHFLLTNLLLPKIEAAGKGARIVNLTSNGHQMHEMRFNDYNFDNGKAYNRWLAYGQSKTANILFTTALASKLASKGILSFAVHPGAIQTHLGDGVEAEEWPKVAKLFSDRGYTMHPINKNLAQGTSGTLYAALDPSLESHSGSYISDAAVAATPDYAHNPELAERLWSLSENIVGEEFRP